MTFSAFSLWSAFSYASPCIPSYCDPAQNTPPAIFGENQCDPHGGWPVGDIQINYTVEGNQFRLRDVVITYMMSNLPRECALQGVPRPYTVSSLYVKLYVMEKKCIDGQGLYCGIADDDTGTFPSSRPSVEEIVTANVKEFKLVPQNPTDDAVIFRPNASESTFDMGSNAYAFELVIMQAGGGGEGADRPTGRRRLVLGAGCSTPITCTEPRTYPSPDNNCVCLTCAACPLNQENDPTTDDPCDCRDISRCSVGTVNCVGGFDFPDSGQTTGGCMMMDCYSCNTTVGPNAERHYWFMNLYRFANNDGTWSCDVCDFREDFRTVENCRVLTFDTMQERNRACTKNAYVPGCNCDEDGCEPCEDNETMVGGECLPGKNPSGTCECACPADSDKGADGICPQGQIDDDRTTNTCDCRCPAGSEIGGGNLCLNNPFWEPDPTTGDTCDCRCAAFTDQGINSKDGEGQCPLGEIAIPDTCACYCPPGETRCEQKCCPDGFLPSGTTGLCYDHGGCIPCYPYCGEAGRPCPPGSGYPDGVHPCHVSRNPVCGGCQVGAGMMAPAPEEDAGARKFAGENGLQLLENVLVINGKNGETSGPAPDPLNLAILFQSAVQGAALPVEKREVSGTNMRFWVNVPQGFMTKPTLYRRLAADKWEPVPGQRGDFTSISATILEYGDFRVMGVLGGQPFQWGEVYVYPNPARAEQRATLHIEVGQADKVMARIYDVSGDLVYEARVDATPVAVNGKTAYEHVLNSAKLKSGVYIVMITAHKQGLETLRTKTRFTVVK